MAKKCVRCGNKIGFLTKINTASGEMCAACGYIAASPATTTIEQYEKLHAEQKRRLELFRNTSQLDSFLSSSTIVIDTDKDMFRVFQASQVPYCYLNSEVTGYEMKVEGAQTITKKKGGITRAVVGGALLGGVGAIVGAGTAKEETTSSGGVNTLTIDFDSFRGKHKMSLSSWPRGFTEFLDQCIAESEQEISSGPSEAEEIRKYKELLDDGIISQAEFDAKKKQLLGL